jgi:hypothetical protein
MKPKIPTQIVPSDDCTVTVGQVIEDGEIIEAGVSHYIHQGEIVEILPIMTVREVVGISRLQSQAGDAATLGENFQALCQEMSKRIISWDWTDLMGEPLEQPYRRPEVLEALTAEELLWLVSATTSQESADARKKDSRSLANTSSATVANQITSPSG